MISLLSIVKMWSWCASSARPELVPDSDVIVAESQLAADETLKPGLEQQLSVAKHALAVLIGRAPGNWSPPDFDLAAFALPHRLPVSLPSQLVHQRPDIQAAEAQLHAASAQIGIATAQLYPSITLSAGISASSLNGGRLFNPAGLVWSVASGLTQPIFDGGMREAERRAALAAFKASAADYQQTVLQAFGQVADILQALTHDTDLLVAQQRALDMASEAVRLQSSIMAAAASAFCCSTRSANISRRSSAMFGQRHSATRTRSSYWWPWAEAGGTRRLRYVRMAI